MEDNHVVMSKRLIEELEGQIQETRKQEDFQRKEVERCRSVFAKHIANMPIDHIERQEYKGYEADMIRHYWVWRNVRTELDTLESLRASVVCEDVPFDR